MRRLLLLLGVVAALAGASSAGAATTTVSITKSGFTPRVLAVNVGDTVTWKNNDSASHQIILDASATTSPVLKAGQSWSFTFTKADGYPYRDKLNEALKGNVNVNAKGEVSISQVGFQAKTITVAAGDTVTWINRDSTGTTHQVVANDGSFTSPTLKLGGTYSHTFEDGGTFNYHDGLHPSLTGSVAVGAAAPVSIVLQASTQAVTVGGGATISGSVAGTLGSQVVAIVAQPTGQASRTIAVTPDSSGAFSLRVAPTIGTTYQALVKSTLSGSTRAQSSTVTIAVAPRLTLRNVGKLRLSTVVTESNAIAGHRVFLTRWNAAQQRYVSFTSARLRATANPNVFTAVFQTKRRHVKVRTLLPQAQAGAGYTLGTSNAVTH